MNWRSKKFIIISVLVVLVLGGTLGGVAIAQADDQSTTTPTPTATDNVSSFLQKVADIYKANTGVTIDPQQLQKAIADARQAMRDEALSNYLQKLVTDGKITQDQADQFMTWWNQRPSLDVFQSWLQSMPDIPGIFGGGNGMGPFGGMRGALGNFRMGFRLGMGCAPDTNSNQ
jgi:hypothetical protein